MRRWRWNVHLACDCIIDGDDSYQSYLKMKEALQDGEPLRLGCNAHGEQEVTKIGGHSV